MKQNPDIAIPGDNFCESVWQLQIEPPLSISTMHRDAMLIATILNSGKVSLYMSFEHIARGKCYV